MWQRFSDRGRPQTKNPNSADEPLHWSHPLTSGGNQVVGHLRLLEQSDTLDDPIRDNAVQDLARILGELLNEVTDARRTAETLASEIAMTAPLLPHKKSNECLSQRLQSVLEALVDTLECTAAAMYTLDDATSELQTRSIWGLPLDTLTAQPRLLETAKADLEAMLGHVVTITDRQMFDLWRVPEREYESAVCVPLATATTVFGTVWIFHDQPRTFEDRELNLIEVLAGRLAMEIEHAALVSEAEGHPPKTPTH